MSRLIKLFFGPVVVSNFVILFGSCFFDERRWILFKDFKFRNYTLKKSIIINFNILNTLVFIKKLLLKVFFF